LPPPIRQRREGDATGMMAAVARRLCRTLFLLAACLGATRPAVAQTVPAEQAVRAAMVFNFLKFTEFPPADGSSPARLRLCFAVGDIRQAEALQALANRKVWGRELVVLPLTGRDDDCQAVYVDSARQWNAVAEEPGLRQALTISSYPGFVDGGGMIEIALQNDSMRFDINLAQGRRAGFRFSPQLLRLARKVRE
jgi:YfiR/HmsC-like